MGMPEQPHPTPAPVECCPATERCFPCETLYITQRLPRRVTVGRDTNTQNVMVEVALRFKFERCQLRDALASPVHTLTLMPGQKVRLTKQDRNTRYTTDSATGASQFAANSSQSSAYSSSMDRAFSSLNTNDSQRSTSESHSNALNGGGSAGLDLGFFEIGGSVAASSYDASSTSTFTRNFSAYALAQHSHTEAQIRASSSVSYVQTNVRHHAQGSSEDHLEASSETFENTNLFQSVTHIFHQLVTCERVKFTLEKITVQAQDPKNPTSTVLADAKPSTGLLTIPAKVRADDPALVEKHQRARAALDTGTGAGTVGLLRRSDLLGLSLAAPGDLETDVKKQAEEQVRRDLQREGLLTPNGDVDKDYAALVSWEREMSVPVDGEVIKSCLDDCVVGDPWAIRAEELRQELMAAQIEEIRKRTELMDKHSDYRCCPKKDTDNGDGEDGDEG